MQDKQQRARRVQPGGCGVLSFLPFRRDVYPPVSLKPWVAMATMETPGSLQPPSAGNILGTVTLCPTVYFYSLPGWH